MSDTDVGDDPVPLKEGRRSVSGENRLPPAVAVVVAIVVYALLPGSLLFTHRLATPIVELLLLVALVATNPRRMTRETRWSRWASIGLAGLMILTNLGSLGLLVSTLSHSSSSGSHLLVGAMQIWVTNVIGFGLLSGSWTGVDQLLAAAWNARRCRLLTGGSPRTRTPPP